MVISVMNEKYRVLYEHVVGEPGLMERAMKRAREDFPEEATMN